MAIFKELSADNIKSTRSYLSQLVDALSEDISGSTSRRKYQHFVTGSSSSTGVTSSLYQSVYDSDFTLQTSNPVFDITFGLYPDGSTVASSQTGTDSAGKELFPSSSLMMREKMDIYRQFASTLLGDSTSVFTAPFDSSTAADEVDTALFIAFKRLFSRDRIQPETFALRFYQTASILPSPNLVSTTISGSSIYSDIGSSTAKETAFGGAVGNLVDASNTSRYVGNIFYDKGIVMLDMAKIVSGSQFMSGTISAVSANGTTVLGGVGTETFQKSKFIPDFVVSASIDNVIDHISACRFSSGSNTAITFQNQTNINSTLIFCRAGADEFNYSSNPTYTDSTNSRITVIEPGQEDIQNSFTYITKVGLYDANSNLLAVASVSRPVYKDNSIDLSFRLRLDF